MSATAIADHALLSDRHSSALVDRAGSVEWLAFPRFDSPSVFGRLLDPRAGHWQIRPSGEWASRRRYLDRTLALETTFSTQGGAVQVLDLLNQGASGPLPWAELARDIRPERGGVPMRRRGRCSTGPGRGPGCGTCRSCTRAT